MEGLFLDLDDRYWLALEQATMRYEERGDFISDDDLLDMAIARKPGKRSCYETRWITDSSEIPAGRWNGPERATPPPTGPIRLAGVSRSTR